MSFFRMVKRYILGVLSFIFGMIFSGCGSRYNLSENPIEFNTREFINPNNEDDGYSMIEYDGKFYLPYGTLKGFMKKDDVGDCIGYVVQDGVKIKDTIICLLVSDIQSNYLIEIDTVGFMSQPIFLRAIDTVNMEIITPSYIDNLGYEFRQ